MEYLILDEKNICDNVINQIIDLTAEAEHEFIPHLTKRMTLDDYIMEMLSGKIYVCLNNGKLAGYAAVINKEVHKDIPAFNFLYFHTVIIDPKYRNMGISKKLLKLILKDPTHKGKSCFSRTWSTNQGSIKMHTDCDFRLVRTLKNARGRGVHTLVFKINV